MACMEHYCPNCDWTDFNNKPRSPAYCPVCGEALDHIWDEEYDHYDD